SAEGLRFSRRLRRTGPRRADGVHVCFPWSATPIHLIITVYDRERAVRRPCSEPLQCRISARKTATLPVRALLVESIPLLPLPFPSRFLLFGYPASVNLCERLGGIT